MLVVFCKWITFHFPDIDLKVAAKFFGTKFACGSSVTGDDEIVIQGDVKDDLFDIIPEKWPEVSIFHVRFYVTFVLLIYLGPLAYKIYRFWFNLWMYWVL